MTQTLHRINWIIHLRTAKGTRPSFEILKEKYLSEKQDFYRCLQMWHYVNVKVKDQLEMFKYFNHTLSEILLW